MTTRKARAETSALISLEELLTLEQSRIRDEEQQRRMAEERVLRERLEAEAKAEEAARAQLRAEAESRREATRLEEARRARVEAEALAMQAAARVHAEAQAKLEMMRVANQHAEALRAESARGQKTSGRLRGFFMLATLLGMGALGFLLQRSESKRHELEVSLTRAEDERDERGRALAQRVPREEKTALEERVKDYERELAQLRSAATAVAKHASPASNAGATIRTPEKTTTADPCAFYRKLRETNPHDPRLFDPANGCL
ncbi:MAG: hypothetical protein U0174_23210 [Polyangiaceae bacterium]